MPSEKDSGKKAVPSMELSYPENLSPIYSNSVNFVVSNWDMTFDFGIIVPHQGARDKVKIDISARIIMSPQHAKAFSQKLTENIQKYEEMFGPITFEPKKK